MVLCQRHFWDWIAKSLRQRGTRVPPGVAPWSLENVATVLEDIAAAGLLDDPPEPPYDPPLRDPP